jgi:hypothetical protein
MSTERNVISQREARTMVSAWTEYLCVRSTQPGVAIAEICQHEAFCEFNEEDEEGNPIPIPDYFEGKKVVGIDYGYLVGEELGLTSDSEEYQFQYTEEEIDALSEWIKKSGFKLNDEIIASVKNALK